MINKITIREEDVAKYDTFMTEAGAGKYADRLAVREVRGRAGCTEATVFAELPLKAEGTGIPVSMYQNRDGTRELNIFTNYFGPLEQALAMLSSLSGIKLTPQDVRSGETVIRLA